MALGFSRHLGSSAAEMPVKFQSDAIIITSNHATSSLRPVRRPSAWWIKAQVYIYISMSMVSMMFFDPLSQMAYGMTMHTSNIWVSSLVQWIFENIHICLYFYLTFINTEMTHISKAIRLWRIRTVQLAYQRTCLRMKYSRYQGISSHRINIISEYSSRSTKRVVPAANCERM